jgi:hypothetical protein
MDTAFTRLVAVCERLRHLTGALETIRNLLMADAMTANAQTRSAIGDSQATARGLFIHAMGLRQRTGQELDAAVQHIGSLRRPRLAPDAASAGAEPGQEQIDDWLQLCGDLARSLQEIDGVLAELDGHFRR